MRKLFALIFACVFALSLVACTAQMPAIDTPMDPQPAVPDASNEPDVPADSQAPAPSEEPVEPSEEPTEPEVSAPETTEPPQETEDPAPPTGHIHSYTASITAPGCEAGGQTTHTCACGDTYITDKTAATGHNFGEWVTVEESTVTKNGTAERTCAACGKTETKQLDKLPIFHSHSYTDKVVAPTCTAEGYTVHTCQCGDSYVDSITAKASHNYKKTVTAPSCTAEGYTTFTCACGHSYIGDKTAKTAHSYKDTVTAPTCDRDGYTTHTCTKCGGTAVDSKVPAIGHQYTDEVMAPTCDQDGYTKHTCAKCGRSQTDSKVPATGHANTKTDSQPANCTYDGWEKVVCSDCGKTLSEKTLPASGQHSVVTMRLSDAADKWPYLYSDMAVFYEHTIVLCEYCGEGDLDSIACVYATYQAAEVMLGYVNALRESVYGTSDYNLVLDSRLIEVANMRAKEISVNYSHAGMRECLGENIGGGTTIYNCYSKWNNSSGHRDNMLDQRFKYFGFGWYYDIYETKQPYAVQLFK